MEKTNELPQLAAQGQRVDNGGDNKAVEILRTMTDTLFGLYDRWKDEKEYEDFNDYKKVISEKMTLLGALNVSLTKDFKITYTVGARQYTVKVGAHGIKFVGVK